MKKLTIIRANKTKFGGAERYLQRLSDELSRIGVSHDIINSPFSKWLPSWVRAVLFNIYACIKKKNIYFSLERVTCSDIYRAGDGVHKEFLKTKKRKLNPLNIVYLYLEERCFKNSKKIIANSKMVKEQIVQTYRIHPKKIEVIYNGIELKPLQNFNDIKKEFDLKDEKVILYIGSGFERKGVKEALEICSKINSNYRVIIIGKEKKIGFYRKLARNLKVNAIFTGPRSDVDKFYSMADIFLFPTHYEPFSNVVLEAMSFKCVVFTTRQNGASEILDEKFILKTPQDYSVVAKIEKLLNNAKELEAIKEKNYQISKNFTIEKNAKLTMEIINEYLH